jgi:hypothetical protein
MNKENLKQDIIECIKYKEIKLDDYDSQTLYEELDYDGSINEIIDSNITIYYYDLRKWSVENYDYIEQAIDEGLVDMEHFDFHKAIQAGQYLLGQELAFEIIEELFEE